MNSDIRILVSFKGHRKRHQLEKLLGSIGATRYLVDLWLTAAQQRPDGDLKGWRAKDIAIAAGYSGKPQKFVDSLLESGFLDRDGEGYRLHDWAEHQPWCCGAPERQAHAHRAAEGRWRAGRQAPADPPTGTRRPPEEAWPTPVDAPSLSTSECIGDAPSIEAHMPLTVSSPSPIPTLPNHTSPNVAVPLPVRVPQRVPLSSMKEDIISLYKKNEVQITDFGERELATLTNNYPVKWFTDALKEAARCHSVEKPTLNWAYIKAILERWEKEGNPYLASIRHSTSGNRGGFKKLPREYTPPDDSTPHSTMPQRIRPYGEPE